MGSWSDGERWPRCRSRSLRAARGVPHRGSHIAMIAAARDALIGEDTEQLLRECGKHRGQSAGARGADSTDEACVGCSTRGFRLAWEKEQSRRWMPRRPNQAIAKARSVRGIRRGSSARAHALPTRSLAEQWGLPRGCPRPSSGRRRGWSRNSLTRGGASRCCRRFCAGLALPIGPTGAAVRVSVSGRERDSTGLDCV
jgi:hypothetical protein